MKLLLLLFPNSKIFKTIFDTIHVNVELNNYYVGFSRYECYSGSEDLCSFFLNTLLHENCEN